VSLRRRSFLVPALALVGSQAGHLVAYQVRFGAASASLQSTGPHAYFPLVAKTGLGVAAVLVIACLFVIGLARFIGGRPLKPDRSAPPFLSLLAALFTIQLACFSVQETAEAYLAGGPPSSAAVLLLWGTLGQLPVALLSALAIRWLLTRFAAAVTELRAVGALVLPSPQLVPAEVPVQREANPSLLLSRSAGPSLAKRGPPHLPRFGHR